MTEDARRGRIEGAEIIQVDLLDDAFVVVSFSNGVAAKIRSEDVRQLVVSGAVELADSEPD